VATHRAELARIGVPPERVETLDAYLELLGRWNRRVDLTAAQDPIRRVEVLVRGPLEAETLVEGPTLLDVGSGNGSPGLVLALLRPELEVTLLEPRLKRWAFLREACRELQRPDIRVVQKRHDQFEGVGQTVTLRALQVELGSLERLVAPGGLVLVFGAGRVPTPRLRADPQARFRGQAFRRCST